jgi:uncharacterized RDD family membrane protein YckC
MNAPETNLATVFQVAPLWRRMTALAYELALLFGVYFIAAYAYLSVTSSKFPLPRGESALFSLYIWVVFGLYFGYAWTKGGQTVAMKAWDIKVLRVDGGLMTWRQALGRYVLGWVVPVLLAACLTWLLIQATGNIGALLFPVVLLTLIVAGLVAARADSELRFLHDRLVGTHIVSVSPKHD